LSTIEKSSSPSRFDFLLVLFALSGGSSLVFETIFTRLLTYTFGNTAYAVSTVFAAFLGGLSIGAFIIGRWVDKHRPSLMVYGWLELAVGAYCIFLPKLFDLTTEIYVTAYHRFAPGPVELIVLRFWLAALVMLVPTMLMGGSLPALARYVSTANHDFAGLIDRLYASNTVGAAVGALVSTFLLIPAFGINWTIGIACTVNFLIFGSALIIQDWEPRSRQNFNSLIRESVRKTIMPSQQRSVTLLLGAFFTGAVALTYEVLWTHVLSFTVGNTVYAFGTMLFAILCGMGWGARIVSRHFSCPDQWARALAGSQLILGLAVLLFVPIWDRIPEFFDLGLGRTTFISIGLLVVLRVLLVAWRNWRARGQTKLHWLRLNEPVIETASFCLLVMGGGHLMKYDVTFFVAGEFVRFFCSVVLLIVPATLLGLSFPLLLNLYAFEAGKAGSSVGGVYSANTLGAIAGSILTGFVILPCLGSFLCMRSAGAMNIVLAAYFAIFLLDLNHRKKLIVAASLGLILFLLWILPGHWDVGRLSRGSYVYFGYGYRADKVLYSHEDVQGGLTTVVQIGPERFLLSNGKFQGNDGGAVQAQIRFALIPVLFTREFKDALVIGLGTGNTLRTISHFPFRHIDAAELVPSVVEAARQWFENVNGRVFDRDSRIHLSIADGRNFLLVSRQQYDLITIEISSIWIAGEADLYNREFYHLCRKRLRDKGIVQQWVQIHHMRTEDLLVILNTVAQEFPYVAFAQGPTQGLIIASTSPLTCDVRQLTELENDGGVRADLRAIDVPSMVSLLGEIMVYGDSFHQALSVLPVLSGRKRDIVSTDFYPYLEYQTPRDNVLPYDTAKLNLEFFHKLQVHPLSPDLQVVNLDSQDEKNLVLGYVSEQEGEFDSASEYFRNVNGELKSRAGAELDQIRLHGKSKE
jgi:spermidine synthase